LAKRKQKVNRSPGARDRQQEELLRQQWMLRLQVSVVYICASLAVVLWMTRNLPNPMSAHYFFQNSHALWFINIGLMIVFILIQRELTQSFKQQVQSKK